MKKILTTIIICVYILLNVYATVYAESHETYIVEHNSSIEKSLNLQTITEPLVKKSFAMFDVNAKGQIALGFPGVDKKHILIYSEDGVFEQGYEFSCSGSYAFRLEDSYLILYLFRANLLITISEEGEVEQISSYADPGVGNTLWGHDLYRSQKEILEKVYTAKSNLGPFALLGGNKYEQLTLTAKSYPEVTIYKADGNLLFQSIMTLIIIFAIVLVFATTFVIKIIKYNRAS